MHSERRSVASPVDFRWGKAFVTASHSSADQHRNPTNPSMFRNRIYFQERTFGETIPTTPAQNCTHVALQGTTNLEPTRGPFFGGTCHLLPFAQEYRIFSLSRAGGRNDFIAGHMFSCFPGGEFSQLEVVVLGSRATQLELNGSVDLVVSPGLVHFRGPGRRTPRIFHRISSPFCVFFCTNQAKKVIGNALGPFVFH